jgi:hypothetical protein
MSSEKDQDAPAPLPVWLSIPMILVCLAGGGWIIHWYVMTDPISHEAKLLGDAPVQTQWRQGGPGGQGGPGNGRPRANFARRAVILDSNNGTMEIRTERAHAMFTITDGKASLRNIFYTNAAFLPEDAHKTILAAKSLAQDQKRTEALKLDVHQVNRLRALSSNLPMSVTADDRNALVAAADEYSTDAKARVALEPKLLQQLDELCDKSLDATKRLAVERAAEIDKIITPEMWKQDTTMGGAAK